MVKNHSVNTGAAWKSLRFGTKRVISTLDINLGLLLNLDIRWSHPRAQCSLWLTGGPGVHCQSPLLPLALPSTSSLPCAFSRFLHRRCLMRRASRPYRGSARRASCRSSVHLPRGPARCRHCSRIRLRTLAIGDERRWWTSPTVHQARAIKTAGVPLSSSSHLASLLLLLLSPLLL